MTPLPYPRTRSDEHNVLTIGPFSTTQGSGIEFKSGWPSEAAARAYVPSWLRDEWYPTPALTRAVVGGKTMQDMVVPGVNKLIREGVVIPTNPMSSLDRDYPPGLATYGLVAREIVGSGNSWGTRWIQQQCWTRVDYARPAMPAHDLNRLTAARAKMQSGYMDMLTFVAEFHKTVELIVKFRQRVLTALDDMVLAWSKRQKRPFRTYAQAFQSLSEFWLEWRFGWRILFYDYEGIREAINDLDGSELRRPFRDRRERVEEVVWRGTINPPNTRYYLGDMVCKHTTVKEYQFSGGCLGDGRLHAGTIDPLVTAWELLPLSLVLDMFWNLGDWIAANSVFAQVTEVDAWTSVYLSTTETVQWEWVPPTSGSVEIVRRLQPVGCTSLRIQKDRRLQTLQPGSVGVDINLSPSKIFDLVAIGYVLRGLVTKRVRFLTNRG